MATRLVTQTIVERMGIRPMQAGGDGEPLASLLTRPSFCGSDKSSTDSSLSHLACHDQRREPGNLTLSVDGCERMHGANANDDAVRLRHERRGITPPTEARQTAREILRLGRVSKLPEQARQARRVTIGRCTNDH